MSKQKELQIGGDFSLSLDAVTQTFAILAKRGVGKTYTGSVMAEEMLSAGQQIVAVDPTGAWWGLREGFPVVILGGEHADVPLEESAGEVVAQAIVENRFPAVIDLSLFRKGQMIRFMVAFAETLYRLNREPIHLFVDEADAVAPQAKNWGGDENRMLGAMEDIVRRGRKRGIGCTLITQRPAVLNKNVLTQCEVLVAMRLVHPKDIDAIEEWVNVHADPQQAKDMIASLPSLPVGTAWFWSPGWGDIFEKVKVRKRETFDSSATPKPGETPRKPKKLAEIDLNALGTQIKSTVERAKGNDPKHLRAELARLRAELAKAQAAKPAPAAKTEIKRVELAVVKSAEVKRLEAAIEKMEKRGEGLVALGMAVNQVAADLAKALEKARREGEPVSATATRPPPARPAAPPPSPRRVIPREAPAGGELNGDGPTLTAAMRRILDAAAWWHSIGVDAPSRAQVAFVARIKPTGGHFSNSIGPLITHGLLEPTIDSSGGAGVRLSTRGASLAQPPPQSPTLDDYHQGLRAVLATSAQVRILDAIIAAGGESITVEKIGQATGIDPGGGHFSNSIGPLSTLGLIDRRGGVVRPTELLFPPSLTEVPR